MVDSGQSGRRKVEQGMVICVVVLVMGGLCVPAMASINVWQVLVEPAGEIIGNQTRVSVTAYMDIFSEDRVTFSPDNTLRMKTDLEEAVWVPVLLYDGRLIELPVRQGRVISLSSWELSYPSGKKEALKVTVKGWAPGVGSDQEKTLLWLAEESPHGIVKHTEKNRVATVLFRPGATRQEVPLVPTGSLQVTSEPAGARIVLDGVDRGITPATLEHVPAGDQALTLSLPGYHDAVFSVSVLAGQTVEVSARLIPGSGAGTGVVRVESTPPAAAILLGGEERGLTPLTIGPLPPGRYPLRLELAGYEPYEGEVEVTAGGSAACSVHLMAAPPGAPPTGESSSVSANQRTGSVQITSSPPGADVILDGDFRGLTPLSISSLLPGDHTVTLTHPFFADRTEHFTLGPGEEKVVHSAFGLKDVRLPGIDAITGLFSSVKIGLPSLPGNEEAPAKAQKGDREKAYEDLVKQVGEGEG